MTLCGENASKVTFKKATNTQVLSFFSFISLLCSAHKPKCFLKLYQAKERIQA